MFNNREVGRGRGRPSSEEQELLRGSLVFAIGALDAYLSDLILEIVPAHAPQNQRLNEALARIAKDDFGLVLRITLAPDDRSRREEFRGALEGWLAKKSFHGPEKVVDALSYVGCPIKWSTFDQSTSVNTAEELTRITKERHGIVHQGKKPKISQSQAQKTINLVEAVATVINKEVCKLYPHRPAP
ncbi:HEPN domain-containing protein [Streptomyces sp. NPDC054871]